MGWWRAEVGGHRECGGNSAGECVVGKELLCRNQHKSVKFELKMSRRLKVEGRRACCMHSWHRRAECSSRPTRCLWCRT